MKKGRRLCQSCQATFKRVINLLLWGVQRQPLITNSPQAPMTLSSSSSRKNIRRANDNSCGEATSDDNEEPLTDKDENDDDENNEKNDNNEDKEEGNQEKSGGPPPKVAKEPRSNGKALPVGRGKRHRLLPATTSSKNYIIAI